MLIDVLLQAEEVSVCRIDDLMSASVNPSQDNDRDFPFVVTISRKHGGHPQVRD